MIRVLLVDDEPLGNAALRALLVKYRDITIIGEALGGREAVRMIRATRPDLVFLDVQMPECDGFAVLRSVGPDAMPPVIFVTAFDAFAVKAFEVRAIDYLLKPVAARRLARAVERAHETVSPASRDSDLARRLRALLDDHTAAAVRTVMVRVGRRDMAIPEREIDWIEADDYCSILHTAGQRHVVRATLSALVAQLDPDAFVRVHRSAIINLHRVRELKRQTMGGLVVVLHDGTHLAVSRARRDALLIKLGPAR